MFFLFAMISFVTNLAAPIGTIWGYKFAGNSALGMMGNMMNFLAYLIMGIPAGLLILRIGYKKTALAAIVIGIAGLVVQWLSSFLGQDVAVFHAGDYVVSLNFLIYLLGAFVCGFCVCMLNTVVNPLLNLLGGGGKRGNQLLQAGGSLNSLAGTLTPFLVGALIGQLTDRTAMGDVAPLLWIAIGIFAFAFLVIAAVKIPEPQIQKPATQKSATPGKKYSPWSFRHTVLGVIAIFFYVGTEVGIPGTLLYYLSDQNAATGAGVVGEASKIAGAIAACYWLLMLVGRMLGSAFGGLIKPRTQLLWVSGMAIALVIAAIFIGNSASLPVPGFIYAGGAEVPACAYLLVLVGLCTSVMWGCIFNLATEGLGKYTAIASGIFMMMVVGGGVMPLLQTWLSGVIGYMASYWLVVAMLVYILFYAFSGSKNVNSDIPVDDEVENAL